MARSKKSISDRDLNFYAVQFNCKPVAISAAISELNSRSINYVEEYINEARQQRKSITLTPDKLWNDEE